MRRPRNINHVTVTGRLVEDPVLKSLPSGHQICEMRIACNHSWQNMITGSWDEWTDFLKVQIFGAYGAKAHSRLRKGSSVAIEGRLTSQPARCSDPEHLKEIWIHATYIQFLDKVAFDWQRGSDEEPPEVDAQRGSDQKPPEVDAPLEHADLDMLQER
jgi:single-strand DNA-binding protein